MSVVQGKMEIKCPKFLTKFRMPMKRYCLKYPPVRITFLSYVEEVRCTGSTKVLTVLRSTCHGSKRDQKGEVLQ